MTGEIFISYRRDDSAGTTGRIFDRITKSFPREKVFMDVDASMHGLDFARVLDERISACDVVVVIVGPGWLNATDAAGRRRFDNPQDFVRVEIAAALRREIPVIPVLVDGAVMPGEDDLPPDVSALARRHAVELRNTRFGDDADTLVEILTQRLGAPARRRKWLWPAAGAGLAVAAVIAALSFVVPTAPLLPGQSVVGSTASMPDTEMARKRAAEAEAKAEAKAQREREAEAAAEAARLTKEREYRETIERLQEQADAERRRRRAAEEEAAERRKRQAEEQEAAEQRRREEEERQRQAVVVPPRFGICDQLWHQRNAIYHEYRYCFTTERAIDTFGNANCFRSENQAWRAMGSSNRSRVKRIKIEERANGC